MTDRERNKQTVTAFYDLAFNQCKPCEAMQRYVAVSLSVGVAAHFSAPAR